MVYADNAATTKMSRTAIDAMLPYMETHYGKYFKQNIQNSRRSPNELRRLSLSFYRDAQVLAYASCLFSFFSRSLPCA